MATTTINVTSQLLYSATFFDTTTQNNGGATTANQVRINTTQQSNGFTLSNNSIEIIETNWGETKPTHDQTMSSSVFR